MNAIRLEAFAEQFPIAGRFTISRGSKTVAEVVHVTLTQNGVTGHGECVPYARYGETVADTLATLRTLEPDIAELTRDALQNLLPPGAARNALDCALWDLTAKQSGESVAAQVGLQLPHSVPTAFTISFDTPEIMAEAARKVAHYPLLKLKLGGDGDPERMRQVRTAVPDTRLVVDANEGWRENNLAENLKTAADCQIELVEQPLPAGQDDILANIAHPVPICADESAHALSGLSALANRYDVLNIKLDKTGGLTEAIALAKAAQAQNMRIMVGCMVSTSLSMAPALHLAPFANWIDLDGPLLLANDRTGGLSYENGHINTRNLSIWGA